MKTVTAALITLFCTLSFSSISAENLFSVCRFHFGTDNGKAQNNATLMAQVDYLTAWAGSSESYNMSGFFTNCKNNNKTPVVIAYIIAFTARRDLGLQDCNVGTPNLCQSGANYIREQMPRILAQYAQYAKGAAQSFGTANPIVWCMEPDYSQYADAGQSGGGLTAAQAGTVMGQILDTIRVYCPKSVFSMDISPWKDTTWQKTWFAAMKMSNFTFVNTSGGQSRADQTYISDTWSTALPTWAWVFKTYGTPLLADADYGTAGGSTGYDTRWNSVANLTARIKDGVIGVSHYNPASSYPSDITSLRSQIPAPPKCPTVVSAVLPSPARIGGQATSAMSVTGTAEIIDLSGKVIAVQQLSQNTGARNRWQANGKLTRSGIYFIRVRGKTGMVQKKIIFNK